MHLDERNDSGSIQNRLVTEGGSPTVQMSAKCSEVGLNAVFGGQLHGGVSAFSDRSVLDTSDVISISRCICNMKMIYLYMYVARLT